jgi:hypothetical protein
MAYKVRQVAAYGLAGFILLLLTLIYGSSSQGRIVYRHTVKSQHDKRAEPDRRAEPDLCMLIFLKLLASDVY